MITFRNGDAKGLEVKAERSPLLLRVAFAYGQKRALTEHSQEPQEHETVEVYVRETYHGVRPERQENRRWKRWHAATYRLHTNQPGQVILRTATLWRQWAIQEQHELT